MDNISDRIWEYLRYCKEQKHLSENTIRAYRIDMQQFIGFLGERQMDKANVVAISKDVLKEFVGLIQERYAPKTCRRKIACIKAFFNHMEYEDVISVNPFRKIKVKLKEEKTLPKTMKKQEITLQLRYVYELISKAKSGYQKFIALRLAAIYELLIVTGFRIGELCKLKTDDIDFDDRSIRILGKGGKERVVYLTSNMLIAALRQYAEIAESNGMKSVFFFRGRSQRHISEESARNFIENIAWKTLEKKITPHMFRHTFATMLLESNVDIKYIQELLGHSSIKTTMIYLHLGNASVRAAVEHANLRMQYDG